MKNFLLSKPLSLDMFERVDPAADEDWKETRSVGLCGAKAHSAKMRNQRETRKELGEERIKKQSGEGIGRCIKGRENGQLGSRRDVSWNENEGTGARKIAALFREPEKSHQLFPQKYSRKGDFYKFSNYNTSLEREKGLKTCMRSWKALWNSREKLEKLQRLRKPQKVRN